MRNIVAIFAFLLSAAFGTQVSTASAPVASLAKIRKIAVVSVIGDSLTVKGALFVEVPVGRTTRDIEDWKLDDLLEKYIIEKLNDRFVVIPFVSNRRVLWAAQDESIGDFINTLGRQLPNTEQPDAYLLVLKFQPRGYYDERDTKGLILERHMLWFGSASRPAIIANFTIVLVDAKTRGILASQVAHIPPQGGLKGLYPSEKIDENSYAATASALTSQQMNLLRNEFAQLLSRAADQTLFEVGLVLQAPPPTTVFVDCVRPDGTKYTIPITSTDTECKEGGRMDTSSGRLLP